MYARLIASAVVFLGWAMTSASSQGEIGVATSSAEGIVVVARSWDISAEVNNKISRLHFLEGQIVEKGDLLVEFDTAFKKLEMDYAQTILDRSKAQYGQAVVVLARAEKLAVKNVTSEAKLQEVRLDAEIARANMRLAEIDLEKAKAILAVQKLYAPFDGQMSAPRFRENANVNISRDIEIATIIQLDPIHVRFRVPYDRMLARMRAGETDEESASKIKVKLELPDGSQYEHIGRLLSAGYGLDAKSGMASVLVEFPNPKRVLRPGLRVIGQGYEQ